MHCRLRPAPPGYFNQGASLIGVTRGAAKDQRLLGTLYVRSDMSAIYDGWRCTHWSRLLVIGLALLVAWAIIATPAEATVRVDPRRWPPPRGWYRSATTTACARTPAGINELDDLTDAFNHMLAQTEQYERRLSAQVSRLALLQQITHSIGSRHDLKSIFQVVLRQPRGAPAHRFGCVCLHNAATTRRYRRDASAPPATSGGARWD